MSKETFIKSKINNHASRMSLKEWIIIQNIVLIIGSVMIYESVDFFNNYIILKNYNYNAITGIGMILPMILLTFAISSSFSRRLFHYISELTNGINSVANGDFMVHLNTHQGGPLSNVYQNFNIMCDELNSIDSMRNDFINEFSHEFKTPLASINGFSNLLIEGNCNQQQTKQYLTIIATESKRLVSLTENQLLLSKLNSQNIVVDKNHFELDEQIRHCMIMLAPEWEKKKIEVSIDLPDISYIGNKDLMQHIWINLITNAIRYSPDNGEISIDCSITDKEIEIHIHDTGIGIPDDQIDKIFDKYYRANNELNDNGIGIGLSIVKRIVTLCGGSLNVDSKYNEGSTFTVVLPIVK